MASNHEQSGHSHIHTEKDQTAFGHPATRGDSFPDRSGRDRQAVMAGMVHDWNPPFHSRYRHPVLGRGIREKRQGARHHGALCLCSEPALCGERAHRSRVLHPFGSGMVLSGLRGPLPLALYPQYPQGGADPAQALRR